MGPRMFLALAGLAFSCTSTRTKICGEFVCSENDVCTPDGSRCTTQSALDACQGKNAGDTCSFPGVPTGSCANQVCEVAGCGNGIVEASLGEVCDDGNRVSGDGCTDDCKSTEMCGDGVVNPGELCDCGVPAMAMAPSPGCNGFNSAASGATCRSDCKPQRCGDGVVDAPEVCDDGNNDPGDGCRADCAGRWTKMTSNTFADLTAVWASSPSDAWAVGSQRVMHWDGTAWTRQSEIFDSFMHHYTSVCGTSPTTLFASTSEGRIYRYQGAPPSGTWTDITPSAMTWPGYTWSLVYCRGGSLWIGGIYSSSNLAAIAPWNGSAFTPSTIAGSYAVTRSIWSSSDGGLYLVDSDGQIFKQTSTGWAMQVAPLGNGVYLTGTSSTDMTLTMPFGADHTAGAGWGLIPGSDDLPGALAITTVPGTTPTQFLMVGMGGAILDCTAANCKPSPAPTEQSLHGVSAYDATHAFIVGDNGTILY